MTEWPNWIDLIVVTFFLATCYNGFGRGLWAELLKLIGVVGATAITSNFYAPVAEWFGPWVAWFGPRTGTFMVFCLVFLSLMLLVHLVIRRAGDLLRWERLHWSIQGLGLILGGLRGLWLVGLMLVVFVSSGVQYLHESVRKESVLGPQLEARARQSITWVVTRVPGAREGSRLVPTMK